MLRALAACGYQIGQQRVTIVTGGQVSKGPAGELYGADYFADKVARLNGWHTETHWAEWSRLGRHAGPIRNQEMVANGATICAAFIATNFPSRGTRGCIELCVKSEIPVLIQSGAC